MLVVQQEPLDREKITQKVIKKEFKNKVLENVISTSSVIVNLSVIQNFYQLFIVFF